MSVRFTCYVTHTEAHILRTPATDRVWRSPAVPGSTHTEGDMEIQRRDVIFKPGVGVLGTAAAYSTADVKLLKK